MNLPTPLLTATSYELEPIFNLMIPVTVGFELTVIVTSSPANTEGLFKLIDTQEEILSPLTVKLKVLEVHPTYPSSPANTALMM